MTTYTTNKAFQEPDVNSTSWNVPLNSNFAAIDAAFGTTTTITLTGTTYNLGTSDIANYRIYLSGSPAAAVNVVIPITNAAGSSAGGYWVFENKITTSVTITISNAFGGNTVTVPKGYRIVLFSDPTSGVWYANDGIINGPYSAAFSKVAVNQSTATGLLDVKYTASNAADIRLTQNGTTTFLGLGYTTTTANGFIIGAVDTSTNALLKFNTGSSFPGTTRLTIDANSNVLVVSKKTTASCGLGYGTGAGATATATTTDVGINAPVGSIATASVYWLNYSASNPYILTVSNSCVGLRDTVIVSTSISNALYFCSVYAVTDGSFKIAIYAGAGVGASQAYINFAIIKGATS